jgi:hypothetical protein
LFLGGVQKATKKKGGFNSFNLIIYLFLGTNEKGV